MAVSVSYRTYLLEQLGQVRPISSRAMFGGLVLFAEGLAFALAVDGEVYFKVDDSNRPDFVAEGRGPFLPFGDPDKPMQYYQLPEEVLEDLDDLAQWMAKAIAVAQRAKARSGAKAKPKAKPKAVAKPTSATPPKPAPRKKAAK